MSEKVGSVKGTQLDEEFQDLEKVNQIIFCDLKSHILYC